MRFRVWNLSRFVLPLTMREAQFFERLTEAAMSSSVMRFREHTATNRAISSLSLLLFMTGLDIKQKVPYVNLFLQDIAFALLAGL